MSRLFVNFSGIAASRLARACTATAGLVLLAACSSTATVDRVSSEPVARASRGRSVADAAAVEANLDPIPERVARSYDRALAAMQAGDWAEAELELEQMILDEPGFPGPYVNLAIVYEQADRMEEARVTVERALEVAPGFAPASNQLGLLLRQEGRFADAERAYRQAIDSDPSYGTAHYNLGILLDLYLQRPADALEQYTLYQQSLAQPDETVARWIVDLERRAGSRTERVARD